MTLRLPPLLIFLLPAVLGVCLSLTSVARASEAAADEGATASAADVGDVVDAGAGLPKDDAEEGAAVADQSIYLINTMFMFIFAVLVLFMQAGFAMLEVGLNSAKNTVNILFKNVMDLGIGVMLFLFIGYALMYPGSNVVGITLGETTYGLAGFAGFDILQMQTHDSVAAGEIGNVSMSADFLFQVAFAATAATIVSGAVAGRMKFGSYLIYSAVLTGFIYPISGMWKWGGGFLAEMGFQDFAGSVVVHAVGGFAALAGALVLGPRLGRFTKDGKSVPMPGHNLAFAALGVFVLWIGWYGFNPGSQLFYAGEIGGSDLAISARATTEIALTTTIAAAAGAIVAMTFAWILFKKPDLTMALNGVLAGLVAITANCDRVEPWEAILIGGVGGLLVVAGVIMLDKLKIDDPVGAFPVHGICGVWGGIATGLFGTIPDGMSWAGFVGVQCLATLIICVWAFVPMLGLFYVLRLVGFLRVSAEEEIAGLDISEHGMHAYPPQLVVDGYPSTPLGPALAPVGAAGYAHIAKPSAESA